MFVDNTLAEFIISPNPIHRTSQCAVVVFPAQTFAEYNIFIVRHIVAPQTLNRIIRVPPHFSPLFIIIIIIYIIWLTQVNISIRRCTKAVITRSRKKELKCSFHFSFSSLSRYYIPYGYPTTCVERAVHTAKPTE